MWCLAEEDGACDLSGDDLGKKDGTNSTQLEVLYEVNCGPY